MNSFVHIRTFNILYIIYIAMVLKEIHAYVPTDKNILFHQQPVCRRGIKLKKAYFISVHNIPTCIYRSLAKTGATYLLFKEQRQREVEKSRFLRLFSDTPQSLQRTGKLSKGDNYFLHLYIIRLINCWRLAQMQTHTKLSLSSQQNRKFLYWFCFVTNLILVVCYFFFVFSRKIILN